MQYNNILSTLCNIMDRLQDEESRTIFEARINYLFSGSEEEYYKVIERIRKESSCWELDGFLNDNKGYQGIVVYGIETEGIRTKRLLDSCHRSAGVFCSEDGKAVGTKLEGLEIISIHQLLNEYRDWVVVLADQTRLVEMYSLLLRSGFPRRQILFPMFMNLVSSNGVQYFDVLPPIEDEIFVDAGSYDGDTIKRFVEWTKGNYKMIYAFEPNSAMIPVLNHMMETEQIKNVILTPKATWSKAEEVHFVDDSSASRVRQEGEIRIQAVDIDSIVGDDKVTFIKMDVEGSELQSLMGAEKTIKRNKPRLAISVYHRAEDVVELGEYILKLNPDYKLILRQYTSNLWETVLYAY